ncbi:hypothetical protein SAMN05216357_109100 [Porphyromonadaceae bacterium KH3CP3RA]|nr:hypothetical protein SAMN05216357_109100 [Porphyromonadaceae bacterium KH3CP3RA]
MGFRDVLHLVERAEKGYNNRNKAIIGNNNND